MADTRFDDRDARLLEPVLDFSAQRLGNLQRMAAQRCALAFMRFIRISRRKVPERRLALDLRDDTAVFA